MELSFIYELVGYTGSILVAISLMMRSLIRLRFINLVGALVFTIYGFLIKAFPVVFLNTIIVGINVYYLVQMWKQKDYFKLMEVSFDSRYLKNFVDFYQKEIREFFPTYLFKPQNDQLAVFVLRNMVPAGVLIVKPQAPEGVQAEVFLDFVIPDYRDFRAGKFLFEESSIYFHQRGIRRFVSEAGNLRHEAYLKRMGFHFENGNYYRALPEKVIKDKNL